MWWGMGGWMDGLMDGDDIRKEVREELVTYLFHDSSFALRRLLVL